MGLRPSKGLAGHPPSSPAPFPLSTVVPISLYNRYLRFFYYHIIVSLVKIAIFQNDNLIAIKNKDFLLMRIIVISNVFPVNKDK